MTGGAIVEDPVRDMIDDSRVLGEDVQDPGLNHRGIVLLDRGIEPSVVVLFGVDSIPDLDLEWVVRQDLINLLGGQVARGFYGYRRHEVR